MLSVFLHHIEINNEIYMQFSRYKKRRVFSVGNRARFMGRGRLPLAPAKVTSKVTFHGEHEVVDASVMFLYILAYNIYM